MKAILIVVMFATACSDVPRKPKPDADSFGGCDGDVMTVADQGAMHVPEGSPITWTTNPPASGTHYPTWAGWDRLYPKLDPGNYLHNAEHGGIVLLYRCPAGCPDVVKSLLDVARAMEIDSTCVAPIRNRVVVAEDPFLPEGVQVAAVAWNVYYTASCFDPYVNTFARLHYRKGLEDICTDGNGAGGTFIFL